MSQSREREKEIVNVVKEFYHRYQAALDNCRPSIDKYYDDDGHVLFEGKMYKSSYSAKMFWLNLPSSLHSYRNLNHTFYSITPYKHILIICGSGTVNFLGKDHIYTQSLTCNYQDGQVKILCDDYRLMN